MVVFVTADTAHLKACCPMHKSGFMAGEIMNKEIVGKDKFGKKSTKLKNCLYVGS